MERSADDRDQGRRSVLVVEDEPMIAAFVATVLADAGYTVIGPAARLDEALALTERSSVDLAVLDINLGQFDSYPVAAALRDQGVPFVFLTGYGTAALPEDLRHCPCLEKPFLVDDLLATVAALRR